MYFVFLLIKRETLKYDNLELYETNQSGSGLGLNRLISMSGGRFLFFFPVTSLPILGPWSSTSTSFFSLRGSFPISSDFSSSILDHMFILSFLIFLPGEWYNFFSESKELSEEFLALIVNEIVVILPVKNKIDKSTILK